GKVLGIVTLQDAMKVPKEKRSSTTIEAICSKDLLTIFPENSVAEAFEKMTKNNVGRLLVVDRRDRRLLRGIITRSDIMHAIRKNR
ncbi:CBS domain-containing protein, partial [Candidatus Bathyarchaeota archaeon]